ncbi:hypothetical protein BJ742DRAFT_187995 [Cladochytrium replicatum]|nr:hypothetical protein BJ742DRAFT_187995 [Cladochytrium replicatum]
MLVKNFVRRLMPTANNMAFVTQNPLLMFMNRMELPSIRILLSLVWVSPCCRLPAYLLMIFGLRLSSLLSFFSIIVALLNWLVNLLSVL